MCEPVIIRDAVTGQVLIIIRKNSLFTMEDEIRNEKIQELVRKEMLKANKFSFVLPKTGDFSLNNVKKVVITQNDNEDLVKSLLQPTQPRSHEMNKLNKKYGRKK